MLDECLMTANTRMSHATLASNKFQERVRLSNTDKHSAKVLFERCFAVCGFREKWAAIRECCGIHVLAGGFTKIFRFADCDIRDRGHHELSLGHGSYMDLFRNALRLELRHRGLDLRQGAPPADVQQHNEFMIRMFCSNEHNVIKEQVFLKL